MVQDKLFCDTDKKNITNKGTLFNEFACLIVTWMHTHQYISLDG